MIKNLICTLFISTILIVNTYSAGSSSSSSGEMKSNYEKAVSHIKAAKKYEKKGKLEKAKKRYQKAQKLLLKSNKKNHFKQTH